MAREPNRRQRLEAALGLVYERRAELKRAPTPTTEEGMDALAAKLESLDVEEGNLRGELAEIDYLNGVRG